jgi:hypothetical protein
MNIDSGLSLIESLQPFIQGARGYSTSASTFIKERHVCISEAA